MIIPIYLIGCIIAYFAFKWFSSKSYNKWTVGMRMLGLFLSLGSLITVFIILLMSLIVWIFENVDPDKDAKW